MQSERRKKTSSKSLLHTCCRSHLCSSRSQTHSHCKNTKHTKLLKEEFLEIGRFEEDITLLFERWITVFAGFVYFIFQRFVSTVMLSGHSWQFFSGFHVIHIDTVVISY